MKKITITLLMLTFSLTFSYSESKKIAKEYQLEEIGKSELGFQQTEDQGKLLKLWFGNRKSVIFKGKEVGRPTEQSTRAFNEIGFVEGDITYEGTLILNKDGSGKATYKLEPSESAYSNQRIHYRRDGSKVRHGDFVKDFCERLNGQAEPVEGEWSIEGNTLKFHKWNFEISEDKRSLCWEFLEYFNLRMTNTRSQKK